MNLETLGECDGLLEAVWDAVRVAGVGPPHPDPLPPRAAGGGERVSAGGEGGSDAGAPGPAPNQTTTEGIRCRSTWTGPKPNPDRRQEPHATPPTRRCRPREDPRKPGSPKEVLPLPPRGRRGRRASVGGRWRIRCRWCEDLDLHAEHLTRPQTKPRPKARAAHHAADLEDGPRKPGVAQRSPPSPPVRGRRGKREDPMPEHMDPAPNQPPTEGPSRTPRCQRCRRRRRRPHCSGSRSTHTSARAALRKRTDPDRAGARSGSADDPSFGRLVYAFGVVASAFAISAYR
jgi:hypothetical protein